MRLVKTQARITKKHLTKAKEIAVEAVRLNNLINIQNKIRDELNKIVTTSKVLLEDVAVYEAEYSYNKIRKYTAKDEKSEVVEVSKDAAKLAVSTMSISTSVDSNKRTIAQTYQQFADAKTRQYLQVISDTQLRNIFADEDDAIDLEEQLEEKTNGLFTAQNVALASLTVLGVSNIVRNLTAKENNMLVDWVLDLELNNCEYCEAKADDSPYQAEDVEGEIPVHPNCGCTLVPVRQNEE